MKSWLWEKRPKCLANFDGNNTNLGDGPLPHSHSRKLMKCTLHLQRGRVKLKKAAESCSGWNVVFTRDVSFSTSGGNTFASRLACVFFVSKFENWCNVTKPSLKLLHDWRLQERSTVIIRFLQKLKSTDRGHDVSSNIFSEQPQFFCLAKKTQRHWLRTLLTNCRSRKTWSLFPSTFDVIPIVFYKWQAFFETPFWLLSIFWS